MESVEFMSPCLSQITATRGKGQAGDDDECGDGTIANSVSAIPAADHQARVSHFSEKALFTLFWQQARRTYKIKF